MVFKYIDIEQFSIGILVYWGFGSIISLFMNIYG
jgi:hypothetical protein